MRIYLVRHGQTIWNRELKYQGQTDIPLSDQGLAQSNAVGERLSALAAPGWRLYSSDLQRSHHTARAVSKTTDLRVTLVPGLREACFGEWEGLTFDTIAERYPDAWEKWRHDPATADVPGAENRSDFRHRILSAIDMIVQQETSDGLRFFPDNVYAAATHFDHAPHYMSDGGASSQSSRSLQVSSAGTVLPASGAPSRRHDGEAAPASTKKADPSDRTAIVVTHGGAVKTVLAHALGLGFDSYWKIRVDNCSVSVIDIYQEGCIVSCINDTCHLLPLQAPEGKNKLL